MGQLDGRARGGVAPQHTHPHATSSPPTPPPPHPTHTPHTHTHTAAHRSPPGPLPRSTPLAVCRLWMTSGVGEAWGGEEAAGWGVLVAWAWGGAMLRLPQAHPPPPPHTNTHRLTNPVVVVRQAARRGAQRALNSLRERGHLVRQRLPLPSHALAERGDARGQPAPARARRGWWWMGVCLFVRRGGAATAGGRRAAALPRLPRTHTWDSRLSASTSASGTAGGSGCEACAGGGGGGQARLRLGPATAPPLAPPGSPANRCRLLCRPPPATWRAPWLRAAAAGPTG